MMAIGSAVFIVALLVVAVWIIIEVKRLRHKIFAIFLIALILFSYISVSLILKDQDIDFKTVPGVITAGKLYFSWLGTVFGNIKSITTRAIQMEWKSNKTAEEAEREPIFDFKK